MKCERCGFEHVIPAPNTCVRCKWTLGKKAGKAEKLKWVTKLAQNKAPASASAEAKLAATAAGRKEAVKVSKKKAAVAVSVTGNVFGKDQSWWEAKARRLCMFLIINNGKVKAGERKTDEDIFKAVRRAFPKDTVIADAAKVSYMRYVLEDRYESYRRPKYIPEGTEIPPRYYLDDKSKVTTAKPPKPAKKVTTSAPTKKRAAASKKVALAKPKAPAAKKPQPNRPRLVA